jgi:hypothetical protein
LISLGTVQRVVAQALKAHVSRFSKSTMAVRLTRLDLDSSKRY